MGEAGQGFFGPVDGPRATRQWHDQDKVYFHQQLDFKHFLPSAQASKGPTKKPPQAFGKLVGKVSSPAQHEGPPALAGQKRTGELAIQEPDWLAKPPRASRTRSSTSS